MENVRTLCVKGCHKINLEVMLKLA